MASVVFATRLREDGRLDIPPEALEALELAPGDEVEVQRMLGYCEVKAVEALPDKQLRVTFADGTIKRYNCQPLLDDPSFRLLQSDAFFRVVQVDKHGYGVVWTDDVDLAESELWLHGTLEPATPIEPMQILLD